ncbi:MAG: phosphonate C-P lyase system protein PhnH [Silicimonas sp.]|nr:phosphonate C-P lyase system protein PhnH [Silicimonas sp.]
MAHPLPSVPETRSNATFDALMWALSRPGLIRTLPEPGMDGLIDALIDSECRVHTDDETLARQIARTGAEAVPIAAADHVFLTAFPDAAPLDHLSLGSDLYPETGATLILPARIGSGSRLRLTGPGVDGEESLRIDGLPANFWTRRRALIRYPMGFELFLIDGTSVVGLPRSTEVELL